MLGKGNVQFASFASTLLPVIFSGKSEFKRLIVPPVYDNSTLELLNALLDVSMSNIKR